MESGEGPSKPAAVGNGDAFATANAPQRQEASARGQAQKAPREPRQADILLGRHAIFYSSTIFKPPGLPSSSKSSCILLSTEH